MRQALVALETKVLGIICYPIVFQLRQPLFLIYKTEMVLSRIVRGLTIYYNCKLTNQSATVSRMLKEDIISGSEAKDITTHSNSSIHNISISARPPSPTSHGATQRGQGNDSTSSGLRYSEGLRELKIFISGLSLPDLCPGGRYFYYTGQ